MGLWGMPAWVGILLINSPGAFQVVSFGVAAALVVFLWLRTFAVVLTPEDIQYRTLWSGNRRLKLSEIRDARVEHGLAHDGWVSRPMDRLALYPDPTSAQARIDINMKVFDLRQIQVLLEHLGLERAKSR
jgi:hypothetical protein